MSQDFKEYTRLQFMNEFETTFQEWLKEKGKLIVHYNSKGTLLSSGCFSALHELAIELAKKLSRKRLDIDVNALRIFGILVNDQVDWLSSNQRTLLLEDFWNQFIQKIMGTGDLFYGKSPNLAAHRVSFGWTEPDDGSLTHLRYI